LNPNSVRTHIVSRCCVNAPKNHPHKWDYFKRVGRGKYEILLPFLSKPKGRTRVNEETAGYAKAEPLRDTIHIVVHRSAGFYVGEGLEIPVVTQGRSFDELISNLREAIQLHLEGENLGALGLVQNPRIAVTYEERAFASAKA
jgi:predicted RNase H-like HicB family nuclease